MPLPFSDVRAFRRDPLSLVLSRAQTERPGLVPLHLGPRPIWLATDPRLARDILKWPPPAVDKGSLVQTLQPLMGRSLLTNIGEAHQRTKTAVHRHVQRNAAVRYLDQMIAVVNAFASKLAIEPVFNTAVECPPLALHLGCTALFGHEVISAADRLALIKAVQIVEAELAADMFRFLPRSPWKARDRSRRLAHAREIVALVVSRARTGGQRPEVIGSLENAGLSDADINAEILGLLIAGHHTTGSTLAWILYHLALDPQIGEMIALEADATLPYLERNDATVLKRAPISGALVEEVLRLYPAGWWTSREVYEATRIGGQWFDKGTMFMISPWQLHRDPRFWDQPDVLKLERDRTGAAYMPFGIGPRSCIGQSIALFELQLVTLQLASAFTVILESDADVRPIPSVTMLAPPMRLRVAARTETAFRKQVA